MCSRLCFKIDRDVFARRRRRVNRAPPQKSPGPAAPALLLGQNVPAYSPDGDEIFFSKQAPARPPQAPLLSRVGQGVWIA